MELDWQEPPKKVRAYRVGKWVPIFEALRARPGQWALVNQDAAGGTGTKIRKGHVAGCEAGEFETRIVINPNSIGRRGALYLRYVGGSDV